MTYILAFLVGFCLGSGITYRKHVVPLREKISRLCERLGMREERIRESNDPKHPTF